MDSEFWWCNFCLIRGRVSFTRKSCQTVLMAHLLYLVRAISPIMPHLAEDVWQNLPFQYTLQDGSLANFVFDLKWPEKNEEWLSAPKDDVDFLGVILEVLNFLHHFDMFIALRNGKKEAAVLSFHKYGSLYIYGFIFYSIKNLFFLKVKQTCKTSDVRNLLSSLNIFSWTCRRAAHHHIKKRGSK